MKHNVKRLKSLAVALKELEPHIRDGRSIETRPEFKSIRQRPRELLGNWLLAAVACATRGAETVHIFEDPYPHGDGMLVDAVTDEKMFPRTRVRPRRGRRGHRSLSHEGVRAQGQGG